MRSIQSTFQKAKTTRMLSLSVMISALLSGFGCGVSTSGNSPSQSVYQNPNQPSVPSNAANVIPITMGCGYVNEPCVSVTICQHGTAICQTIDNVLLDTGSTGLRLFGSLVSLTLPAQSALPSGNTLAECIQYGDGSSTWGQVQVADIVLGSETASSVPIQIISSTFGAPPAGCPNRESSPATAQFNGILGVGLFVQDCGANCVTDPSMGVYYSCSNSSCTETTATLSTQVANPVASLSQAAFNNGVMVQLPAIANSGATSLGGWLVLGIGTQEDNTPIDAAFFATDSVGNFSTIFNGTTSNTSFIDSGSNAIYFSAPNSVAACSGQLNGFYCPSSTLSFTATQVGVNSTAQEVIAFTAANADNLLATSNPNVVFNDLTGNLSSDFDWGLPFFLGRSIFVGFEGKTSSSGTGPYWVY